MRNIFPFQTSCTFDTLSQITRSHTSYEDEEFFIFPRTLTNEESQRCMVPEDGFHYKNTSYQTCNAIVPEGILEEAAVWLHQLELLAENDSRGIANDSVWVYILT